MSADSMLEPYWLVTRATPGAPLALCIREAIRIAAAEWRMVEFVHNDRVYQVRPERLMDSVLEVKPK